MAANLTISIAALALLLSTECQNAFDFDSDGNIHVAISTRGSNLDSDGYSLTVDGDLAYEVAAQGTLALRLVEGTHTVQLGGLSANCAVDGENPRSIVVKPGGPATVAFGVTCARAGRLGGAVAPT
jgi:hypothetical protein